MTALLIADVKVADDAWVLGYGAAVHNLAARDGGRYLARSSNIEAIEARGWKQR